MPNSDSVVAHLIVGARPEVYLPAALDSIAAVCGHAVINDTSGQPRSANIAPIEQSRFAREGRLTLLRTSFTDFADARNACIAHTPAEFSTGWAFVIDADEVHGSDLLTVSSVLPNVPAGVDAVDGYLRHFVGSFSWWIDLARTRLLFRLRPGRLWEGKIHERIVPLKRRIALPTVWFHYGHVTLPREEARKGRLYASLGQADRAPSEAQVQDATPSQVWPRLLRRAIRYSGQHPAAARPIIDALTLERKEIFAEVDALAAQQTTTQRIRNASRRLNADRLLLLRELEARVRWGWPANGERQQYAGR
jgi:hypothetical protein